VLGVEEVLERGATPASGTAVMLVGSIITSMNALGWLRVWFFLRESPAARLDRWLAKRRGEPVSPMTKVQHAHPWTQRTSMPHVVQLSTSLPIAL
jgi:hypothetical protein